MIMPISNRNRLIFLSNKLKNLDLDWKLRNKRVLDYKIYFFKNKSLKKHMKRD